MRDLYGLVIAEFGSGPLDVAPLNEPVSHALVSRFPITAKNGLNLRKQNAAQEAILLCGRWLFVFGCCVCVCHMFSFPRRRSPGLDFFSAAHQPALLLDHATTMIRRAGCQLPITRFRICNLCRFLNPNIRNYSGCRISGCNCSSTLRNLWRGQFSP